MLESQITEDVLSILQDDDIVSTNVDQVRQNIMEVIEREGVDSNAWSLLELDLTKADIIDSSGLNFLVTMDRHLKEHDKSTRLIVASPHIHRTFVYVRLDKRMDIVLVEA